MDSKTRPAFYALLKDIENERYDDVMVQCTLCDQIIGKRHELTYADVEEHMWEHLAAILTYYSIRQKHGLNP